MQHRLRCLNGAHVACLSIQFVVGVQQDVTDLKTYLEEKARRLGRRGYQLQPHVVVLAEDGDLTSRCVAYACVHSPVFYEAASILEAVDAAFKSMFVLGLIAVDVWTADFLQHIPQLACLFRYTFFIFLANNVKALTAWVIQSNCRKQNCEGKLSFVVTSFISTVQRMFSTTGLVANSKISSFSADKLHRMAFIH